MEDEVVSLLPLLKLQVEEARPRLFSILDEGLSPGSRMIGVEATDPGVMLGSSDGSLSPGPFQGLPGSNSGMPKLSSSLDVFCCFSELSGQPEPALLLPVDHGPEGSRSKFGDGWLVEVCLEPGALLNLSSALSLFNFHWFNLDPDDC